jgi:hypothetical protein
MVICLIPIGKRARPLDGVVWEHGFEVITHGERIIEMAPQADLWKINEDNGTENSLASDEPHHTQIQVTEKKWWKFW